MEPVIGPPRRYAFNLALIGVEAPVLQDHTLLRVQNWSSSAATADGRVETAAEASSEEKTVADNDQKDLGLWVGVRPARADVLRQQAAEPVGNYTETQVALAKLKTITIKKASSVDSVMRLNSVLIWSLQDGMTQVVVRYNSMHADRLLVYELINRDPLTNLCEAHPIKSLDCFFFRRYRDDSLSTWVDRQKDWTQLTKEHLAEHFNTSLKNGGFRPARSHARVEFPPEISQCLLDEMERAILGSEDDFKDAKIPQLIAIYHLMNLDHRFEDSDAKEAHRWLMDIFPNLTKTGALTPDKVSKYAAYLRNTDTRVTYGDIRTGLGAYLYLIDDEMYATATNSAIAKEIARMRLYFHEELQGPPRKCNKVDINLEHWLSDHVKMMQCIVDAHVDSLVGIVDYHGTEACPDNLHDLWENVGNSPDTDSAKFFAKEIVAKCDVTTKNLEEHIKMCKQALKDLANVSDEPDKEDERDEEMG
ncbi:hypothetical protein BKA58DRAFT_465241 [Alternaria rosae]|uniref:uncharacterized protein n=1 Tax=Alternaria rosae TaxID=1187941 RepID=UPI001E8D8992|nr:uncharacterized protein BKA58DRAFT_465241 [Alternaria rosae]KAH6883419.1 hypothetical protein BKA58DRAFT_465241 [Alternaria rosae]